MGSRSAPARTVWSRDRPAGTRPTSSPRDDLQEGEEAIPSHWLAGRRDQRAVRPFDAPQRFYADNLGLALAQNEGLLLGTLPNGTELLFFVGEAVRGTSLHIVFGLDEGGIDSAAEALAACGVPLLTQVTEAPGGWSLEFGDPDGHPLAFFQDGSLPRRR